MSASRLVLAGAAFAELERLARASHPREACALLIGAVRAGEARVCCARPARNLERARPHARFDLHPLDQLAAEVEARERGLAVVGAWHTHPDRPARPSAEDLAGSGAPAVHLITSVTAAGAVETRAWRPSGARWSEIPLALEREPRDRARSSE